MFSSWIRSGSILAVAFSCIAAPVFRAAEFPKNAPKVTYQASGTFSKAPISGNDAFELRGEPFTISITVASNRTPQKSGTGWAVYGPVDMASTVQSGLLSVPTPVSSTGASIELQKQIGDDAFQFASPIVIVGLHLNVGASITMPEGTLTTLLVHPFTRVVELNSATATFTYSDASGSTTLGLEGTLRTVIEKASGTE